MGAAEEVCKWINDVMEQRWRWEQRGSERQQAQGASRTWRAELKLAEESQTQAGGSGRGSGAVGTGLQEVFRVHSPRAKGEGCGAVAAH